MNIVIVEDDARRMVYFRRHLIGSVVHHAKTAKEGMFLAATRQPAVIFLDYDLHIRDGLDPEVTGNGAEVAEWIAKEHRKTQGVYRPRVIIHSFNPTGHGRMIDIFQSHRFYRYHHCAGAWLEEQALAHLIEHDRWIVSPRLPAFTEEFGW